MKREILKRLEDRVGIYKPMPCLAFIGWPGQDDNIFCHREGSKIPLQNCLQGSCPFCSNFYIHTYIDDDDPNYNWEE